MYVVYVYWYARGPGEWHWCCEVQVLGAWYAIGCRHWMEIIIDTDPLLLLLLLTRSGLLLGID